MKPRSSIVPTTNGLSEWQCLPARRDKPRISEPPMGQSLHLDGRPATSDLTSTPDMSLHRDNRRKVP